MVDAEELRQIMLAASAYDAITAARSATSIGALNDILGGVLTEIGFHSFGIVQIPDSSATPQLRLLFGEGLSPWITRYNEMAYGADDDLFYEAAKRYTSFYWNELLEARQLSEKTREILAEARKFGLAHVLCAPLRDFDGAYLECLFAGSSIDMEDTIARETGSVLAGAYASIGIHLLRALHHPPPRRQDGGALTSRQVECLTWARNGKSSTDIEDILNITAGVIDEHIYNACKRLGVRTRAQAILEATKRGFLPA